MKLSLLPFLLLFSAVAAESPPLQVTEVKPVRWEKRGETLFADFGEDAYGNLKFEFSSAPPARELKVRLGEKLADDGTIDRTPPGNVNFRDLTLTTRPDQHVYQLVIPSKPFHTNAAPVKTRPAIGEITPFRYVEIEGITSPPEKLSLHQLSVHAPFDDEASSFESSDETLNAVWKLCKHTMKVTTAFGIYIDGERERIPYEADAYINELSHYACDLDPRVARHTVDHLLKHPTWPTEWSFHVPMMAAADFRATGDLQIARDHYDALKEKLLISQARADGLLRAGAIVDWPAGERDGYNNGVLFPNNRQLGPEYNTVVNAFYYHALQEMALLARALKRDSDADDFESKAKQVHASFNRIFFDPAQGLYTDGEGCEHCSLHANMFPLAFGLTPPDREVKVADFVQSRGMACSVYGAQYLLEALFRAGKSEYALQLMTSHAERSWWHMIESGSTTTWEAWDVKFKPNLTWNHAWGSAPANILSRYVLGVRPIGPGYSKILIAPQPASLNWVRGKVPTPRGPVVVSWKNAAALLEIDVPPGATARVVFPQVVGPGKAISLDGQPTQIKREKEFSVIEELSAGHYAIGLSGHGVQ